MICSNMYKNYPVFSVEIIKALPTTWAAGQRGELTSSHTSPVPSVCVQSRKSICKTVFSLKCR